MVKFKICKEEEKELHLKLQPHKDGEAILCVCNEDGNELVWGRLLGFKSDGTIYLFPCVNEKFGFKTDKDGRIIIAKEAD